MASESKCFPIILQLFWNPWELHASEIALAVTISKILFVGCKEYQAVPGSFVSLQLQQEYNTYIHKH